MEILMFKSKFLPKFSVLLPLNTNWTPLLYSYTYSEFPVMRYFLICAVHFHEPSESEATRGSTRSWSKVSSAICQFTLKGNLLVDEYTYYICSQETCGPEGNREASNCDESADKLCLSQRSIRGTKGNQRCPCHNFGLKNCGVTLNFFCFDEILVLGIFNLGLFVLR